MPLLDTNSTPSQTMQRWFGLSLALFLLLIAGLFNFGYLFRTLTILAGIGVLLAYYLVPKSQIAIIRAWQYLTYPLAFILGHLMLGVAFFGVFLPIGIMLRLSGYDPLRLRKFEGDPEAGSDWVSRKRPKDASSYFRQY